MWDATLSLNVSKLKDNLKYNLQLYISLWVEFLYGHAARLYLGDGHIMSATGVQ